MATSVVTVFGGSGFIGRYLVQRLARQGWIVRVAVRHPQSALFLKPLGDVGQIVPIAASLHREDSIAVAVEGVAAVVNLVGILYERGRQTFRAVHVEGAARVARAALAAGAGRLIHMSALGADSASPSAYARSKAEGEIAALAIFAGASIIRPSIVFGPEDDFFNRFARMARLLPALPLIGGGRTRFQPVYVGDVADAMMAVLGDPATTGRIYELGGPRIYTFRELLELLLREIGRRRLLAPVPFWAARLQALVLERLPVPPLTRDQLKLLERDNVVSGAAPGLAELGIAPTAAEVILPTYLDIYRPGGRYRRPGRG